MKHLVVLHHGLWGNHSHLDFIKSQLEKHENIEILNIKSNSGLATYEGIDVLGLKVASLVLNSISNIKNISFIGYSLGGLILRFAIGILHSKSIFNSIIPLNFISFASPHLGAAKSNSIFSFFFNKAVPIVALRSGLQMLLTDKYLNDMPLLYVMSDKSGIFYKALIKFKKRIVFANIKNDFAVVFTSASISTSNPFQKHKMVVNESKYPSIVVVDDTKPYQPVGWTANEVITVLKYSWVFVLLPILYPIAIPIIYYFTTHQKKKQLKTNPVVIPSTEWIYESSDTDIEGDVKINHKINHRKLRKKIADNLNSLEWVKVSCYLRFSNAHAGIVNRRRRDKDEENFKGFTDVVYYLFDKEFEF